MFDRPLAYICGRAVFFCIIFGGGIAFDLCGRGHARVDGVLLQDNLRAAELVRVPFYLS